MYHFFEPVLVLLLPFFLVVTFMLWVLWKFTRELRRGRRRPIRSSALSSIRRVEIYSPERQVLRFRRRRDNEAA